MSRYVELMRVCPLRPIKSEKQHDRALAMIESLFAERKLNKSELDYLEVLGLIIHNYEQSAYPAGYLSPQEMLKGLMENKGLTQAQLAKESGVRAPQICSILKGKVGMGVRTIDRLAKYFKVCPSVFHDAA